ncbi:GATA zinc finger family protein [Babesia bovis T2Bo]|uniref:GATA-type domain-containing protein n=1 Tax=Babesia bovis TaxID=5865 RepID=A7AP11_BABBO|nr:GATA zinc finger family protein [Babesia bovis T2Bo]EDO08295.1 GATA zinc finger family protein [Babesia bovis T2Bo]|eukprot:XP_001611863.1 hypothetical protein [Babesia bovis T2Bo]
MDDLGQRHSARYDNDGQRSDSVYGKGLTPSNSFVLSDDFGDKPDDQEYHNPQCGITTGYMDIGEQYCDDVTTVHTEGNIDDSSLNDPMQAGTMLYDYSQEYCQTGHMGTTDSYDSRNVDGYGSPLTGKDPATNIPRSMSGGFSGGMIGTSAPSMTGTHETIEDPSSNYWCGYQMTPPPYGTTPPGTAQQYPRTVTRYGNYRYGATSPYYPMGGSMYSSYPVERNMPYPAGYSISNESYYNSKQPYMPYTPRRSLSSTMTPGVVKSSSLPSHHIPIDQMQYKGWYGQMGSMDPHLLQPRSVCHPNSNEPPGSQRTPRFNSEILYNELTSRLQRELTNKRHVSSGRPKMNRHNYVCAMCNAKTTPQWRYIKGTSVCNACYMRIRKQKLKQQQQDEEIARCETLSAGTDGAEDGHPEDTGTHERSS